MPYSYYVDKRIGTSADTLLAVGFATLVQKVLAAAGGQSDAVELHDRGHCYEVTAPAPISDEDLAQIEVLPFIEHLDTPSQEKALGAHYGQGFDYERERQIRDAYREKRKELPPQARSVDAYFNNDPALALLEQAVPPPDTRFPLYLVINQMKVASSFNEPVTRWLELPPPLLRAHIRLLLDLFAQTPNPVEAAESEWKRLAKQHDLGKGEMTMLQVINPTTGKGANRTKANALSIGGLDAFWLLELLKFAGFFALAHPQTISDSKDRKTYVLRPRTIQLSLLDQLIRTFRRVLWSNTPAKMDVMAVLQMTRVLVEHERAALLKDAGGLLRRRAVRPSERIQGFDVTFYKDMGSAYAVMNTSTLNLPEWVPPVTSVAEADRILVVLKEHINVIRTIQAKKGEERTEEYELLRRYRDFLSGRDIEPFLDFAAKFAPYLSHKIERNEPCNRFLVQTLKELIAMSKQDFVRVVEDPGFQHIADAIRSSTVSLQYAKGMKQPVQFDIRYGLAHDLVRSANDADGFVLALSDFVARYNNEAAQTFETSKSKIRRRRITENDLAAVVRLLGEGYRPKTLAQLLVAFGSAKSSEEPTEPKGAPEAVEAAQDEAGE
ncbi:hypothetical protein F8S13_18730 [Chloroflexia bacterium SDU3-3]|nr:hypothetical protein F8S13_18730 [Chloroflexia bacterium SDU3-3]